MSSSAQRYAEQRSAWVELQAGVRVKLKRPDESVYNEVIEFIKKHSRVPREHSCAAVIDWEGFTEQLVFGEGSDKPLPFDADLAAEVIPDRMDWSGAVDQWISTSISEDIGKRFATRKK